jgi:hypothetical protein
MKGSKACMAAATLTYMNKLVRFTDTALPPSRPRQAAQMGDVTTGVRDDISLGEDLLQEAKPSKRRRIGDTSRGYKSL